MDKCSTQHGRVCLMVNIETLDAQVSLRYHRDFDLIQRVYSCSHNVIAQPEIIAVADDFDSYNS